MVDGSEDQNRSAHIAQVPAQIRTSLLKNTNASYLMDMKEMGKEEEKSKGLR